MATVSKMVNLIFPLNSVMLSGFPKISLFFWALCGSRNILPQQAGPPHPPCRYCIEECKVQQVIEETFKIYIYI